MRLKKRDLKLTKDPIKKLIKQIAIPASIGFFFMTMYNVVDTFFAGLISTDALAAMTLSFPLFIVILAVGNGVGIGASALIGNSLGAEKLKEAKSYVAQAISFGLLLTVVLSVVGIIFSKKIFFFLGATESVALLANQYIVVLFIGAVFFVLTHIFNAVLIAQGDTKSFRNMLIAGFFLNLFLDPLFLLGWFGLPMMGVTGIALATVIIQVISCAYLFFKVANSGLFSLKHVVKNGKPTKKLFKAIAKQGLPASFNHLSMAIGFLIITYFVGRFSMSAVAAVGVSMRVEQIAVMPAIGLNMAALSLVGQNNGAKLYDRVKQAVTYCLRYGFLLTLAMSFIIFLFAKPIIGLFTDDAQVIKIGLQAVRIASLYISAYVLFGISVSSLQAMKKPYFAMWGALGRQLIGPLVFFPLFTKVMGLQGIFWSICIIAWTVAIISLTYLKVTFKKLP